MSTAAFLLAAGLLGVSVIPANAASNPGSTSTEYSFSVSVDSNGVFTVPANTTRASVNVSVTLSSQNAATFSNQQVSFNVELKDPSNNVVTDSAVKQLSPSGNFYSSANWSATGLNGYQLNTPVTIGANNTSLNINFNAQIQTFDGTYIPTGNYQFTYTFLKNGTAYVPDNNDSINRNTFITLGGTSFTNPAGLPNNSVPRVSVATCINRSLVSASDTLTVNPTVTSTGTVSSQATRIFQGASMGQSTLLSNTSTLSLASVNLSLPISVGMTAEIDATAGTVTSADLSVTRGDGTEVTQSCTPQTPSAPSVSFPTSTTLRATFTVSSSNAMPRCLLYLASDLNTIIRQTGGMPDSNRLVTCNFSGRTAGESYVVKAQEYFDFYYYESGQGNQYFNIYRTYPSAQSQASLTISSQGVQGNNNQNSQPTAQEIAAAQAAIQAAIVAAIVKAKTTLHGTLQGDKPGTLDQYRAADYKVNNEKVVAKVNAEVLKLPLADRENVEKIAAIIKVENFVDLVSTPATQKRVTSKALVELGLFAADNPNKTTIANALKKAEAASLSSIEKIQEAIKAELAAVKERKDRLAEIKAKIAGRNK